MHSCVLLCAAAKRDQLLLPHLQAIGFGAVGGCDAVQLVAVRGRVEAIRAVVQGVVGVLGMQAGVDGLLGVCPRLNLGKHLRVTAVQAADNRSKPTLLDSGSRIHHPV